MVVVVDCFCIGVDGVIVRVGVGDRAGSWYRDGNGVRSRKRGSGLMSAVDGGGGGGFHVRWILNFFIHITEKAFTTLDAVHLYLFLKIKAG